MQRYKTVWAPYAIPETGAQFASKQDIRNQFAKVDAAAFFADAAGTPILAEDGQIYLNDLDESTACVGETGSKKTRCFVMPTIFMDIKAGNSMIITDVKGELSSNAFLISELKKHDYRIVYMNYRTFDGDGYNVFEYALELYKNGETDIAVKNIKDFIGGLFAKYTNSTADPFWQDMGNAFLKSSAEMLMRVEAYNQKAKKGILNLLSLMTWCNDFELNVIKNLLLRSYSDVHTPAIENLKMVATNPEKTRECIMSTSAGALGDYTDFEGISRMHSESTFDIREAYEKPMAVFFIVPDETKSFAAIAGGVLDNMYQQLIDTYTTRYAGKKPQRRIDFICDEFCNFRINDMNSKISASRSRFMRWFIIVQSLNQLKAVYEKEADIILANCKNVFYLQSCDAELRKYISDLAGNTSISELKGGEPLLPVEALKKLKKDRKYKDAIFLRDSIVFKTSLPDISVYPGAEKYADDPFCEIPKKKHRAGREYSPSDLVRDIGTEQIELPYKERLALSRSEKRRSDDYLDKLLNEFLYGDESNDE